jgi:anti-sigma factor RsiW
MRTLAEIVPLRTSGCRPAIDAVIGLAAAEPPSDPQLGAHVASCLRCQAEVAAFRRVVGALREMGDDLLPVPAGAMEATMRTLRAGGFAGPEGPDVRAGAWGLAAFAGGITAAGAAGIAVWFSRRRPLLSDVG